jgi:hypothetical protein
LNPIKKFILSYSWVNRKINYKEKIETPNGL